MKVLIAGDFCPQGRLNKLIESGDFSSVFSDVRSIVKKTDYSIVNLECPIIVHSADPIEKQGPNLCCSPKGVEALKWAGFKCVTLANNHFLDYGEQGVQDTIKSLDTLGLDYVGGGLNIHEASAILYKEIEGKSLAIINCCEHEFSIATDHSGGSNPLNTIQHYYDIKEAKNNADNVLVIVHGGHEHFQLPSPRMVESYRFFIDAGADAVVNHHQHCYSGYEIWRGKPIFYGLGNFCFDNESYREGFWTEGFCVTIDFSGNEPKFVLHPYTQCAKEPKVELLPVDAFSKNIENLNETIQNPELLRSSIDKYYEESAMMYGNIFEPLYNRLFLAARYRHLLPSFIGKERKLASYNYVMCEAHRDKLIWWLNHHK